VTRKLFWTDPYQATLTTTVLRVDGERLWLDDTIFYAFSGGQESDVGTIGGWTVRQAEQLGLDIV